MLPLPTLKKIVKKYQLPVTAGAWRAAQTKALKTNKTVAEELVEGGVLDETTLYEKVADWFKLPFISLKGREIKKEVLNLIPGPLAGTHQVVAFDKTGSELRLALTDPTDIQTIEFLRRKTGLEPKVYITSLGDLREALRRYHAALSEDLRVVQEGGSDITQGDLKKAAAEVSIINVINSVLEHAVYEGASDIHLEPAEKEIQIRYRIDGILRPVMTLPKTLQNGVVARLKILANLKLDEHMTPQDGRFKIQVQDDKLAFRVSVLPVYDGEKIVMRLLHEGTKPLSLEAIGLLPAPRATVETAIKKPHGLILVTGPTGSGKTTTLYSILGILNQPGVNISTVEDPIEYRVPGVNQSQVHPKVGFTFASGLRALLRQDPNIIMVGEIRDEETAGIAVNAAMTGHLVLSTLHTNDAATALPRLFDMGIPPFLVADTCNLIMAQRLVRKICPFCKAEWALDREGGVELARLCDVKLLPALFKKNLPPDSPHPGPTLTFFKGAGCRRCGQTGFKGRIGIYEVLPVTDEIKKKINQRSSAQELVAVARAAGMLTMLEDGLTKAKLGITTISEVLRVTKE